MVNKIYAVVRGTVSYVDENGQRKSIPRGTKLEITEVTKVGADKFPSGDYIIRWTDAAGNQKKTVWSDIEYFQYEKSGVNIFPN